MIPLSRHSISTQGYISVKIRLSTVLFTALAFCNAIASAQDVYWAPNINTTQEYETLSVEDSSRQDLLRTTKFLAPAHDDPSLLDTVYQNVNRYQLHLEFMVSEFPERFAGLTPSEYMDMVLEPETRSYYAGAIFQFQDRQGNILYGFNITRRQPRRPKWTKSRFYITNWRNP